MEQATRTNSMWQGYFDDIGCEDMTARTKYFRDNISEYNESLTIV